MQRAACHLTWRGGYEFSVDFDAALVPDLLTDEPPPLGEGRGPSPARLPVLLAGSRVARGSKTPMGNIESTKRSRWGYTE